MSEAEFAAQVTEVAWAIVNQVFDDIIGIVEPKKPKKLKPPPEPPEIALSPRGEETP